MLRFIKQWFCLLSNVIEWLFYGFELKHYFYQNFIDETMHP